MKKRLLVPFIAVMLLACSAYGSMYSYKDKNGIIHYTNVPADGRFRLREGFPSKKIILKKLNRLDTHVTGKRSTAPGHRLEGHINKIALLHKVDPSLIKAIIRTESNFNPQALSSQGAQGLMQLMPGTARDLKVTDPFDIHQNIDGGTRYFRKLLDNYHGNIELSLAAYNAGPGRVKPFGTIPRIPETVAYVKKVMNHYNAYRRGFSDLNSINIRQMVTVQ